MGKETVLSKNVKKLIQSRGGWTERLQAGKLQVGKNFVHLGSDGAPDRIALYKGYFIALEMKSDDGKLSQAQDDTSGVIWSNGGIYLEIKTLEQVIKILDTIDERVSSKPRHRKIK